MASENDRAASHANVTHCNSRCRPLLLFILFTTSNTSIHVDADSAGERLRNELFCVEWDVKPQLSQSIHWDDGGQRPHGGKRVEVTPLISPSQAFENQK